MNLYDVLGVQPNATTDEIKKAFRKKALDHHPDKKGGSEIMMKELVRAKEILTDPDKRAHYDATGEEKQQTDLVTEFIMQAFNEAFEKHLNDGNLVQHVETKLSIERVAIQDELAKMYKVLAILEKHKGRVIRKGEGANAYEMLLDQKTRQLTAHIQKSEEIIERLSDALEQASEYEDTAPVEKEERVFTEDMLRQQRVSSGGFYGGFWP